MFEAQWINKTKYKVPKKFLNQNLVKIYKLLKKQKAFRHCRFEKDLQSTSSKKKQIVIVLVSRNEIKKINNSFRYKNKTTDILSFSSADESTLGELILCPEVIKGQALSHKMTLHQEYLYLLIHGILHLLGYDHELSQKNEKEMFDIQDKVFSTLCSK